MGLKLAVGSIIMLHVFMQFGVSLPSTFPTKKVTVLLNRKLTCYTMLCP